MNFNPTQFYEFGKSRGISFINNTFIGGVSSYITSAFDLSLKLSLNESDIQNFTVNGTDIECYIGVYYTINASAFNLDNNITSYIDNDSFVTSIGVSAFQNCTSLTSITMPIVTSIGVSAFQNCTSLAQDLTFNNLTVLGLEAFRDSGITAFNSTSLTSLPVKAFFRAYDLLNIDIPLTTYIGNNCFDDCTALIGDLVFNSLTTLDGAGYQFSKTKITSFSAINLTNISSSCFNNCSSLLSVNSPLVTSIGGYAFQNCTSLTSITMPIVTSIGFSAFQSTTSLSSNLVFNNLTALGSSAFRSSAITGFSAINLSNIQTKVFFLVSTLTNINLPSVTLIGTSNTIADNIFLSVPSGCSITVPIAMETVNGGDLEPDLLYARDVRGAIITYV